MKWLAVFHTLFGFALLVGGGVLGGIGLVPLGLGGRLAAFNVVADRRDRSAKAIALHI